MAARLGPIAYDGYPAPGAVAVKSQWNGDFVGSNNYQVGGYNMNASALGMGRIELADFSFRSQSGNYYARALYPAVSSNSEQRAPGFSYVTVKWYIASNNAEVGNNTDLSAEIAQLFVVGM